MRDLAALSLRASALVGSLALAVVAGCAHEAPPAPALPPPPPEVAPPPPVVAPPPPAPPPVGRVRVTEFKVDNNILKLPGPIEFVPNTDKLSPASDAVLEVVHDYLDAKPEVTLLRIEGHTDSDGNAAANLALSEKRAMTVARWLVGIGVKCERLLPVGFGHTSPIVPNDTPANKAQNRRIAFVNAQINRKAVGNTPVDGAGNPAGDPCK